VVAFNGGVETAGDEGGGVAEEVNVLVDLLDDFKGEFGDEGSVGDEEDRDFFVAMADAANDVEGGALFELRASTSRSIARSETESVLPTSLAINKTQRFSLNFTSLRETANS